jgi:hypothetical protein
MQVGILIIGSLLWDKKWCRDEWRHSRLVLEHAQHVRVRIGYRRRSKSRGNTFTMTFAPDSAAEGQGVVVPCDASVVNVDGLLEEARQLWRAEDHHAARGAIASQWGCLGTLFNPNSTSEQDREPWCEVFRNSGARPIPPVSHRGLLAIPWPAGSADGKPVDLDVLLATATRPEVTIPPPSDVAEAWCRQGHEEYFFENVRHGLRTPEDALIWARVEALRPPWLHDPRHAEPINILRRETNPGV